MSLGQIFRSLARTESEDIMENLRLPRSLSAHDRALVYQTTPKDFKPFECTSIIKDPYCQRSGFAKRSRKVRRSILGKM
ncbi:unnamed protein product [Trichobilharzia regenti]|nr:unnamed protein product [Trichobilharzia regenti]